MICCATLTAFAQQDSILITDDEYRTFRIHQEKLIECQTIQQLKDTQYNNATKTILLKDEQIVEQKSKVLLAGSLTETVRQELLLSQSETKF